MPVSLLALAKRWSVGRGVILLTGANGVVGVPMAERLASNGVDVVSVSRKPTGEQYQWDLSQSPPAGTLAALNQCRQLIHCAPIWLLPPHLLALHSAGVKRIVAFSSSSVISKQHSGNAQEQMLVNSLTDAEHAIERFCREHDMQFTLFRPSMIYGRGLDENVTHIAKFITKRGFMLLAGQAKGLRQPVQAEDLVTATLTAIENPKTVNKTYTLAGAEQLTYRAMVERIFIGLNRTPRVICIPLPCFRLALKLASLFTSFNYTPEMANRMNQDLAYSNHDAIQDFAYSPQAFLTQPERDLP